MSLPGFVDAVVLLPPLEPGATHAVEVRLERGRKLSGRALGPDGAPVAGVSLSSSKSDSDSGWQPHMNDFQHSDVDGRFTILDAPTGPVRVTAWRSASGRGPSLEATLDLAAGGDVEGLEIRLVPGTSTPGEGE